MLDISWIRQNPEAFDEALKRRNMPAHSTEILHFDKVVRQQLHEVEMLRAKMNEIATQIARCQDDDARARLKNEAMQIKNQRPEAEEQLKKSQSDLTHALASLPNLPHETTPDGPPENMQHIKTCGDVPTFSFEPLPHEILGERLGMMNFQTAAAMSGARFVVLSHQLARLERALIHFMCDVHEERGYTLFSMPYLLRSQAMYHVGHLPKMSDDLFHTTDDRFLIATGEAPLTNLWANSMTPIEQFPQRVVAHTPCFRKESGSAGRDQHGMIRHHQFHKVELVHACTPEQEEDELAFLLQSAEEVLKRLKLPYRVMLLTAQDMGFASRKTFDIEVWMPGQAQYREISSCSSCGDFQARRMHARLSDRRLIYTLNGSGLAVGRTMIAIMENYQTKDGNILIPDVLQPYMRQEHMIQSSAANS